MAPRRDNHGPEDASAHGEVVPFRSGSARSAREDRSRAQHKRRIEIDPEDVIQPDRRPWARLSLEGVVVRSILLSGLFVLGFLALAAAVGRALGAW